MYSSKRNHDHNNFEPIFFCTLPPAYFRIQQPSLISGLSCALNTGTLNTDTVTLSVRYSKAGTTTVRDTSFSVTLSENIIENSFYNSSLSLNTGDKVHLYLNYTGNSNNAGDLTAQIDLF